MKNNNKKINFLKIAKIILFTVILTIYPISNIYAKYISKDGASQNATVAKFDVSESFVAEETKQYPLLHCPVFMPVAYGYLLSLNPDLR